LARESCGRARPPARRLTRRREQQPTADGGQAGAERFRANLASSVLGSLREACYRNGVP